MNKTRNNPEEIRSFLSIYEPFTTERVMEYYANRGEVLSTENLKVRINRLKSKGVIVNVSRGIYRLMDKKPFEPEIIPTLKKLSRRLNKEFPFMNYVLWSSSWLNDLTTLQLLRNFLVIEVEAGSKEAVFSAIKDSFPSRIFLDPKEKEWENYMSEKGNIIIKTMITESPAVTFQAIKMARLEKILVDIFCDKFWKNIFSSEIGNIYSEAFASYSINYSTLLSYASRRGKREEIWNYIKSLDILESSTIEMMEK